MAVNNHPKALSRHGQLANHLLGFRGERIVVDIYRTRRCLCLEESPKARNVKIQDLTPMPAAMTAQNTITLPDKDYTCGR